MYINNGYTEYVANAKANADWEETGWSEYVKVEAQYGADLENWEAAYAAYVQGEGGYKQWEEDYKQWEKDYTQWEEDIARYNQFTIPRNPREGNKMSSMSSMFAQYSTRKDPSLTNGEDGTGDDDLDTFGKMNYEAYLNYLNDEKVGTAQKAEGMIGFLMRPRLDEDGQWKAPPADIEDVIRLAETEEYAPMLSVLTAIPGVANLINKVLISDGAGDY